MIFGLGYSALAFARRARSDVQLAGTVTSRAKQEQLVGILPVHLFDGSSWEPAVVEEIERADALIASVPPDADRDPVLRCFGREIATAARLRWIGYLSTVGVYGDHEGGWVDEATPPAPANARSRRRLAAECEWSAMARGGRAVHLFRLAGIYGPGRNALVNAKDGRAMRILRPGQIFNRVHVDDIAQVLAAALRYEGNLRIWNVADDEPSPPQDVVLHAARLLGLPEPREIAFEEADLSLMARSFWDESKRVSNARIRRDLGVTLAWPTYREGLAGLMAIDGPGLVR